MLIIILGSVTPNFLKLFSQPHEIEFKHINNVIKILRNDAILKNNSFCVIFDLNYQRMMTKKKNIQGECYDDYLKKPKILEPHNFSEELILKEARLAGQNIIFPGDSSDFLNIHINSSGFVTPFFLKFALKDFSKSWEIETIGIMGKLIINEH